MKEGREERGKGGRKRKTEKKLRNKSNTELELSSFTYDHKSSDNTPFNYILKSILNKETRYGAQAN